MISLGVAAGNALVFQAGFDDLDGGGSGRQKQRWRRRQRQRQR
jgi:hypothetical protein